MGAHTWGHTGTTGAVGCRGAAPGEQVGVSGALLKGTSSVEARDSNWPPVQLLHQYATDAPLHTVTVLHTDSMQYKTQDIVFYTT